MKFASQDEEDAYFVAMAGKILHEYTHYGDRDKNEGKITGQGSQNDNPRGLADPNDNGVQAKPSKFGHRGTDIEHAIYRLDVSMEVKGDWREGKAEHFFNK